MIDTVKRPQLMSAHKMFSLHWNNALYRPTAICYFLACSLKRGWFHLLNTCNQLITMTACSVCDRPVEGDNEKCEECNNQDDVTEQQTVMYVRSELLTYACNYVNRCTPDSVIEAIVGFYKAEEIINARDILWKIYEEILDDGTKRRCKENANIATLTKVVEDIIFKGLIVLTKDADRTFPFCAVDITRIPKYSPEEQNLQSALVRLATLEQDMKHMKIMQHEIKDENRKNLM